MNKTIAATEQEERRDQEIRAVYNSGDNKKSVEMAIQFLKDFPDSYLASLVLPRKLRKIAWSFFDK